MTDPLQLETSPAVNVPFTPEERAVHDILTMALGSDYAVPLTRICERTGLSEREVKDAVMRLRLRQHGVGSGRKKGYFIITTAEELLETVAPYQKQALTQLRVVRALMGPHSKRWREFKGQMLLDLEKETAA